MRDLARIRAGRTGSRNAGWAYDAYPDLPMLDAGAEMVVAELDGPAVVTTLHVNQHRFLTGDHDADERQALAARGIVLEVTFDGAGSPSVRVPLADFFADGLGGRAAPYSTSFVEKTPQSYNCYLPMPFERGARIVLRNDTPYDLPNYTYVEFEELPSWPGDVGYLHATWSRRAFQLDADTCEPLFGVTGAGHLVGHAWSIASDDPFFAGMRFAMEGNVGFAIDGRPPSDIDYLGSECLFGQCWGYDTPFVGTFGGVNHVQRADPVLVSAFRFRDGNVLRFAESLDVRIDWTNEFRSETFHRLMDSLPDAVVEAAYPARRFLPDPRTAGHGWIDYATTWFWYQQPSTGIGYEHQPMPSIEDRTRTVLRENAR